MDVENMDCYENLANAIILQAVKDYKHVLRILDANPANRDAKSDASSLERFFRSQWFGVLTELDPDRLMSGVKERVRAEAAERRKKKEKNEMKKLLRLLTGAGAVFDEERLMMLRGIS